MANTKTAAAAKKDEAAAAKETTTAPVQQDTQAPNVATGDNASNPAPEGEKAAKPSSGAGKQEKAASPEKPGMVKLRVVTHLPSRVRAGIKVTKEPKIVEVSEEDAQKIEADSHISAVRQ